MISGITHEIITLKPEAALAEPPFDATIAREQVFADISEKRRAAAHLNVLTAEPVDSNRTIVFGLPWSEYATRPDASDRYRAVAQAAGMKLVAVDVPGMNHESRDMPLSLSREVSCGNFNTAASLQWQALENSVDFTSEFTMVGYSMGAHTVASMVKVAPEGAHVDKLVLWEPVSRRQNIASLAVKFALEERRSARYRQENPSWMHEPVDLATAFSAHARDYLRYGLGMTHGGLGVSLRTAREQGVVSEDTEIVVAGGSRSHVSSPEDNMALAYFLRRAVGFKSIRHIEFTNESHSMINSTPRMAAAIEHIVT